MSRMRVRDDEAEGAGARRRQILEIAARLFARKGYRGTSMRDIGEAAGVLGGSLYHHIKSKDALFVELHHAALDEAEQRIAVAVGAQADPWARLEAACSTLLDIQLDPASLTMPMMNDFREVPDIVRGALMERRDRFEALFRDLVSALPLPSTIDRSIYRNLLLSQLNSAADWVRPGRLTPREIAAQIMHVFRHSDGNG
ncbi:TetR/AcrR family transcriptional regulator [Sphingobium sp. BYY-5]|uniref:TetR/AcrR family transcriptional regulator n=1 Tax=Sphingobium sp. BYY-5 TaxID=2926400 RepID=UPI001FA70617|nr:TetR/AcrR family transcriptional regulator [Sphingobium sp. BYY-5]MCI4592449.1 TetR/AcrR family transcriptional regulator [Sphingobium sp. BYY-5]